MKLGRLTVDQQLKRVDDIMSSFLQQETSEPILLEAMLYSIHAGGKRLRPLICLAVIDFMQKEIPDAAYSLAASIELVHTYSLIHDDLPAMDNDTLRRGKPTNHVVYGEGIAVLAGDGLLTESFHLLSKLEISGSLRLLLIQKLARAIGTHGMISGQAADLLGEAQEYDAEQLQWMHERKTGALIEYAFEAPLLLLDIDTPCMKQIRDISRHFGLAFQIRDDILDACSTSEDLGKTIGKDEDHNKTTYVRLYGIHQAYQLLQQEIDYIRQGLRACDTYRENTVLEYILDQLMISDDLIEKGVL